MANQGSEKTFVKQKIEKTWSEAAGERARKEYAFSERVDADAVKKCRFVAQTEKASIDECRTLIYRPNRMESAEVNDS